MHFVANLMAAGKSRLHPVRNACLWSRVELIMIEENGELPKDTADIQTRPIVSVLEIGVIGIARKQKRKVQLIAPPGSVKLKEHGKRRITPKRKRKLGNDPFPCTKVPGIKKDKTLMSLSHLGMLSALVISLLMK